jgi:hypothetical protein
MSQDAPTPLYFCVTHLQPAWPLPAFLTVVGSGGYVPERGIALSQSFPDLAYQNAYLGEFAALFALRRMLADAAPNLLFGVSHYRRFALTQPLGEKRFFNHYAHPDLLARALPEHFFGNGSTIIVPSLVNFGGSVLRQYAAVAEARDLLMFFGCAVDVGAITSVQAADFLSHNSFMPACTAAFIPVGWFRNIIDRVEAVAQRYMQTAMIARDVEDQRATGLCCERLYSMLLQQHLDTYGWDRVISTPMTMLTEDGARQ